MKRIIGLLFMLIHLNTSMFIPVMDEEDIFDAHGCQINDINTLTQFISQEIMGHTKTITKDQDDDQAHYFNSLKSHQVTFNYFQTVVMTEQTVQVKDVIYLASLNDRHVASVTYDVAAPPPWPAA
jgi:hypothetical protein